MTTIRVRFGTCNIAKNLSLAEARKVVALAAKHTVVFVPQEIESQGHKEALHDLGRKGLWATFWPGGTANAVPITYRRDLFDPEHRNSHLINDGKAGKWPDEHTTLLVLRHRKTGIRFGVQNAHMIPMAFTAHNERRPDWDKGERKFAETSRNIVKHFGSLIGGLDANRNKYAPAGTTGVWAKRGTFGSAYYDTLFYAGRVQLVGKRATRYARGNPSDHDLLVATFEISDKATTPPKPPTSSSRTPSADKVVALAKTQVGYHEGRSGSNWNNIQKYSPAVPGLEWSQGQAWCATFVSWLALKSGFAALFPSTASTDTGARWWKAHGRWSEYPAIGAQGYLGVKGDMFHTFLVTGYDSTYVHTIEGNTNTNGSSQGDGVYALKRRRDSTSIQGYGYPAYPEGIVSADPAWANRAPKK
ncbi:MAG: 50, phiBT1p18 [Marmoricola sp.]|nr:50, phiBT1p18 [Marmoricola sp.]